MVRRPTFLMTILGTAAALLASGCASVSGPNVELLPAAPFDTVSADNAGVRTGDSAPDTAAQSPKSGPTPARLGFIDKEGNALALENGGRVPLGKDKIAEIFLSPYPPDWNTDLHLFLLTKDDFEPVTDVDVDLEYDMVWMSHGIDAQKGTKIADGRYLMPLSFVMYGDWQVDVTMDFGKAGKKDLRLIVKFLP